LQTIKLKREKADKHAFTKSNQERLPALPQIKKKQGFNSVKSTSCLLSVNELLRLRAQKTKLKEL
jgi:hypothetical protein